MTLSLEDPRKYTMLSDVHILFTVEEGAEDHCRVASLSISNQRIFDWLDEIFKS